jgi:hypothetical protein
MIAYCTIPDNARNVSLHYDYYTHPSCGLGSSIVLAHAQVPFFFQRRV